MQDKLPSKRETDISGLLFIELDLRSDSRGWFEEVWQEQKFADLGLSWFSPRQQNVSFNLQRGVTRGFHAEPWNKLVTVLHGVVQGAWIDLRPGPGFGTLWSSKIQPGTAVFVPRGVANAYQTLEDNTVYSYVVDGLWSPHAKYQSVNLYSAAYAGLWPISNEEAIVSDKDLANPELSLATAFEPEVVTILGSTGQVGQELTRVFPQSRAIDRAAFDAAQDDWSTLIEAVSGSGIIVNAAAFTQVDAAELEINRAEVFRVNYELNKKLATLVDQTGATLVGFSSDYVYGSNGDSALSETSLLMPQGKYAVSKAMGDIAISKARNHFLLRPSWVFGSGKNFVATMTARALAGAEVKVVIDQFGRPTSANVIANAVAHLVESRAAFGTYNISCSGPVVSWFGIAKFIYDFVGADDSLVVPIGTSEFVGGRADISPRPTNSVMRLEKIEATGFTPPDWRDEVEAYLRGLLNSSK